MKTLLSIGLLFIYAMVAHFASIWVINIAGLPGGLLAGMPGKRSSRRFMFGSIISSIGQSYVYLAYVAFVVSWTTLLIEHQSVWAWLVWPTAFLACVVPIWHDLIAARVEAREYEFAQAQVEALHLTVLVAFVAFFAFAFFPALMHTAWGWVPYVG